MTSTYTTTVAIVSSAAPAAPRHAEQLEQQRDLAAAMMPMWSPGVIARMYCARPAAAKLSRTSRRELVPIGDGERAHRRRVAPERCDRCRGRRRRATATAGRPGPRTLSSTSACCTKMRHVATAPERPARSPWPPPARLPARPTSRRPRNSPSAPRERIRPARPPPRASRGGSRDVVYR